MLCLYLDIQFNTSWTFNIDRSKFITSSEEPDPLSFSPFFLDLVNILDQSGNNISFFRIVF